jgi:hypothetical protein
MEERNGYAERRGTKRECLKIAKVFETVSSRKVRCGTGFS